MRTDGKDCKGNFLRTTRLKKNFNFEDIAKGAWLTQRTRAESKMKPQIVLNHVWGLQLHTALAPTSETQQAVPHTSPHL